MSRPYQRIAPGGRPESTSTGMTESRESLESETATLENNEAGEESSEHAASVNTKPTVEITGSKGKVMLNPSFFAGHFLEWTIHLLAISTSIGICLLHFLRVYWTDESTWTTSWRWASLNLNDILKALQFASKAHEILIVASIGAIVLYFARRRLVGRKGIALGLLMCSYRIDQPVNILSSKFWSALSFNMSNMDPEAVSLSLLLFSSAILSQLVGPASAGVIQPSLDWWHVSDPYNGQELPLYLVFNVDDFERHVANPTELGVNIITADCVTYNPHSGSLCPGAGLVALQTWTDSDYDQHTAPNLTMLEVFTGTQRTLAADLIANGTAIAATQSNWVVRLYGLFASFVETHHLGLINSITYPMYSFADPVYAPVVQVQCHTVDANRTNTAAVHFLTDKLTNYTEAGAVRYDAQMSWPIVDRAWEYINSTNESQVSFAWADFSNGLQRSTDMWVPSTGAVARMPGLADGKPTTYIITCIVDARWAASSALYQPTISQVVFSNLSSPAALALSSSNSSKASISAAAKANPRQQLGIGDVIQISFPWAELLNVADNTSSLMGIERMLNSYIITNIDANWPAFTMASGGGYDVNDTAQLMQGAADTVATILSLTVADGLSRLSDRASIMVDPDTSKATSGNDTWVDLQYQYWQVNMNVTSVLEPVTSIRLQVQRYGWAYGWSTIIILDVVVLFLHLFMVVLYAGYQALVRFRGRWWATTAWNDPVELIMLAWDSEPTEVFREAAEAGSSHWARNVSVRERGGGDGDAIELVAGPSNAISEEGLLVVGKKYI